ncbi:MAG: metal ABC transporter ATP-binding protein [Culicoidibacterales bacterium]
MFVFKDVTFGYGTQQIFSNMSVTIEKGEYILLLGPNGSGKSTFIKCLLGLVKPLSGSIKIEDIGVHQFSQWSKIGYVAQRASHINIAIPVSVREVVSMGLKTKVTAEMVNYSLEVVGMSEFAHRSVLKLSGGQQQRVFIARALLSDPEVLILDEPTVGLDMAASKSFYELVAKLHKMGKTIIMVTHDTHFLTKEATRVIELSHGIAFDGNQTEYRHWHNNHCLFCEPEGAEIV